MEKRHGPSISVKMILTTTALIVLIVAGFGLLNIWNIGRVYDDNVDAQEGQFKQELNRVGTTALLGAEAASRGYLQVPLIPELRQTIAELQHSSGDIAVAY